MRSATGLYKNERPISTPQRAHIRTADGKEVLNLCANNYLGLADHPEVIEAAKAALDRWGFGLASVRFICGTQEIHNELEAALTRFLRPRSQFFRAVVLMRTGPVRDNFVERGRCDQRRIESRVHY